MTTKGLRSFLIQSYCYKTHKARSALLMYLDFWIITTLQIIERDVGDGTWWNIFVFFCGTLPSDPPNFIKLRYKGDISIWKYWKYEYQIHICAALNIISHCRWKGILYSSSLFPHVSTIAITTIPTTRFFFIQDALYIWIEYFAKR
jgi:hypothetical protein